MIIPLLVIQLALLKHHKTGLFISMLPILVIDLLTLYSWRKHLLSSMFQTFVLVVLATLNIISFKEGVIEGSYSKKVSELAQPVHHKLNSHSAYEAIGFSKSYLVFILTLMYVLLIQAFMFAVVEKAMKEYWVIRETNEKSFKTMFNIFENTPRETIIVDANMKLMYVNK